MALKRDGYGKGDVIAILAGNSPEWCMTYMAITAIGAVALPLDTNLTPEQYRDMVRQVEARAAFVSAPFRSILNGIALYDIDADPVASEGPLPETPLARDDIASLLFTSGTTGTPRSSP
jgi:long-chain acyl-CoA synthetase